MKNNKKNSSAAAKDRLFHKDEVVRVRIEDIGNDGEGIGKTDGYTLFVKDAVIGDTIDARIMKAKKNYAYARLQQIIKASPYRTRPECPIARQCGGCQIQELSYEKQLEFKFNKVKNDLIRIGGFPEDMIRSIMHPTVGMDTPYRYRNKAQVPVQDKAGKPVAGFYAGHTHVIVPLTDCKLGPQINEQIIQTVLNYMKEFRVPAYDEEKGTGIVRHILIRVGHHSGQIMVCVVINADQLPKENVLADRLMMIPGMTSVSVNVNKIKTNVILGDTVRTLKGEAYIEDSLHVLKICDEPLQSENAADSEDRAAYMFEDTTESVTFRISPLSFYQVNPQQTQKLYSLALHYAGLTGKENVWDLYCGVGTISLFMARHAGHVFGVEIIPEAIEDARKNAEINDIENADFKAGKAEEVVPAYVAQEKEKGNLSPVDVVVVDPPRKGCDERCLQTILEVRPQRIVYVSCDPATLARDLRILADGGYELKEVTPVDQFGHTVHVESVCQLIKTERV